MNELALFAGTGGGILGGYFWGWKIVCAVEIEDYPRRILLERQRDGILSRFPIWDDITTFDGRPWKGQIDIITGGFPCQDISPAGKGAGIAGEKSGLWKEMSRVIHEVRPVFVLVENSSMLTVRGLGVVLGDLAEMGYNARWYVLGADDAGAPHQRKRIWILAYPNSGGFKTSQPTIACEKKKSLSELANIEWWDIDPADLPNTVFPRLQTERTKQQTTRIAGNDTQTDLPDTNQLDDDMGGPGASEIFESKATELSGCEISDTGRKRSDKGNSKEMEEKKKERSSCQLHDQSSGTGYGAGENWPAQSRVGRVAHGMAHRVNRLKAIGNGQVPAVAALAFIILSEGLI
jgi:DNA (cytosine-5)-methyltransferase 1